MKTFMKRLLLLILLLLPLLAAKAQQDPLYNLYSFNQFMINPAYAGVYNTLTGNLISRNQWSGIDGAPATNLLSVTSSLSSQLGAGILLINDRFGVNNNTEGQFALSYKIASAKRSFSFGVQGGIVNYGFDYDLLNLAFDDDEGLDLSGESFSKPNLGAGVFYMAENYYLGLSVPRLLSGEVEQNSLRTTLYEPNFYLSGGLIIKNFSLTNKFLIKPTFLLRSTQKQYALDLGLSFLFDDLLWVGVVMRDLKTIGLNTQLQIKEMFRLGYAFELPTSQIINTRLTTHEFSLMFEINLLNRQSRTERYF